MQPQHHYDELYVISDLHMGGRNQRRQIFDKGKELGHLVDHLRTYNKSKQIGLVLNGDTVDFLAEPDSRYFELSPQLAVEKLERIMDDPSFNPVWESLAQFVQTPQRQLVITLGNHDLELTLPSVRAHLIRRLAGDDLAAAQRLTLEFDGEGYLCQVGDARVLCVHGNEVDEWNWTDYEMLRRIARNIIHGRDLKPYEDWIPNAGTKLVIEVMNGIKAQFPFVDLLKPEKEAVVPILKVLVKEDRVARIIDGVQSFAKSRLDKIWQSRRLLSAGETPPEPDPAGAMHVRWSADARPSLRNRDRQVRLRADALMERVEQRLTEGQDAFDVVGIEEAEQQLGAIKDTWKRWVQGKSDAEILRETLVDMRNNAVFETDHRDDQFRAMDRIVSSDVDFLVTGHTHMQRAHPGNRGPRFYYNSGTWARLMKLSDDMLRNETSFAPVIEVLQQDMHALDGYPGLVIKRPAVVCLTQKNGRMFGELRHATLSARGQSKKIKLEPVPQTRFP